MSTPAKKSKSNVVTVNGCRFLKHGVKGPDGKYYPASYSWHRGTTVGLCVTVYASSTLAGLPKELAPQNDSEMQSDYFEKDRVRFLDGTPEAAALRPLCVDMT